MQLFGSLKLLMALLGSCCSLFGRSSPKVDPKMVPKSGPKCDQILGKKWHQKWAEIYQKAWSKQGCTFKKIALTANCFQSFGLLKFFTWRCLKDSIKTFSTMAKDMLKSLPKWFQIKFPQSARRFPDAVRASPRFPEASQGLSDVLRVCLIQFSMSVN